MGKAVTESTKIAGDLTSFLSEMLKGSRMIKIYQQEKFEFERSEKIITSMMEKQNKIGFIMIRATPIMEILTGIMIAAFIYFSGFMISSGEMQINNFFSFLTAMMLAYQPIRSLATINMLFYQGAAGAERVFKVIDTEPNIKENSLKPNLNIDKGDIEFKNASFAYPKTDVAAIKNINVLVEGGSTAALVGHSGAGKSTIMNLIPRFYDPNDGEVSIDKQNICLFKIRQTAGE